MNENVYVPFLSKIQKVIRHTSIEYTFRMEYHGNVKPGQFFEVLCRNMEKHPFQSAALERTMWI